MFRRAKLLRLQKDVSRWQMLAEFHVRSVQSQSIQVAIYVRDQMDIADDRQ